MGQFKKVGQGKYLKNRIYFCPPLRHARRRQALMLNSVAVVFMSARSTCALAAKL